MRELKATVIFVVLAVLAVCSGCSKDHGTNPSNSAISYYTVSVAADKVRGDGLMVRNNGGDDLYIHKSESVKFKTALADGEPYNVTVVTQPTQPSQTCTVTRGSGVIQGRNVIVVAECTTDKFTVGGTVTGLNGQVIVHNNVPLKPYDEVTIDTPGPFTFGKDVTDEKEYSVSIYRQPNVQTCTVTNGSGTLQGANIDNVIINCVDNVPTVSVRDSSIVEGDTGTSFLEFTVNLSALARYDVTVDYATSDGTATVADNDYTSTSGQLTIYAGSSSNAIEVPVAGDMTGGEGNETLTLTLTNPSSNATFGDASITSLTATGTIYDDDGGVLNDTGITGCANATTNDLLCNSSVDGTDTYPGQDAEFGRDVTAPDPTPSDGHAGFSFVKIANDGLPLADQSLAWDPGGSEAANTQWSCVLDNTTQLMWEVKTTDSGIHDKSWTYSWYDPDATTNGGDPGTEDGGICSGVMTACDTAKLVTAVNADGLCGQHDWRLPTVAELSSLVDASVSPGPTLDSGWFPNSISNLYWSGSPFAGYAYHAWGVNFAGGGIVGNLPKGDRYYVRLVRDGP